MKLGPCGLAVFYSVIEAAVMDCEGHTWKGLQDIFRSDPVFRILGMIIITVNWKTVTADEVVAIAIVVLIFCAHIVMTDGGFQAIFIQDDVFMRVGAVTGVASNVRAVNGKHQSYTS